MSILSKLMSTMRLNEEDDDDYYLDGDDSYEDEDDRPRRSIFSRRQEEEEYDEEPEPKNRFLGRSSAKVVPMRRGMEVTMIKPTTMEDSREVCDYLLAGKAVVLNMEGIHMETAQRIIDFASGADIFHRRKSSEDFQLYFYCDSAVCGAVRRFSGSFVRRRFRRCNRVKYPFIRAGRRKTAANSAAVFLYYKVPEKGENYGSFVCAFRGKSYLFNYPGSVLWRSCCGSRKAGNAAEKAVCLTDSNVADLYLDEVRRLLSPVCRQVDSFVFPAGEEQKNLDTVRKLYQVLIQKEYDRNDMLVALGGGVTGDLCGFAAATYLRGISFIQIPTTLLAQVDSSIGGKTGVDFDSYKNMVGAFHMPKLGYTNVEDASDAAG